MTIFTSTSSQLEDLLHRVGSKLQISKSQRELAESRYKSVGEWLSRDESLFEGAKIDIYPQGSLRIGTTVKPLKSLEFDLDLVCEINQNWQGKDPLQLLNTIEKRLKENKIYEGMVERKNRCIRLNYANEFHMDILPAHPLNHDASTHVKVPDRKAEDWKDSNPKGYAEWFLNRSWQYKILLQKRASIEPLPNDERVGNKDPLKRAVQLIKRYRDTYFEENPDLAPISIVLTTLAGEVYQGQLTVNESISYILTNILNLLPKNGERLIVLNPANPREDLSERWDEDPKLYQTFLTFLNDFIENWQRLNELKGIHEIAAELKNMFGENIINETLKEQAEFIEKARKSNNLSILGSGLLVAASKEEPGVRVKPNTFYGE